MTGYIYIIRRALSEYKNEAVYKLGRTEHLYPNKYLKNRYDPGFKIYLLERSNNVKLVEKNIINSLKTNNNFVLVHGRETFYGNLIQMKNLVWDHIKTF
jgi:hypothetical protein